MARLYLSIHELDRAESLATRMVDIVAGRAESGGSR